MINAQLIYNMIKKHSDIPLTSLPLLISEETPIPVPYEDIPVIIKQLEEEGKIKILLKDEEMYCQAITN
ncbi:hypothetical protein PXD04_03920 [Methanosphaera sp. ISO3-F5]|uniref:hypothetical protein n=1 Tax=Methanosphaera sp. ISO3-F5 TaxID=1452353 RepID=UPI002B258A77|nr:hypothetical protein [Methanosphaera sp. ISO3-F5]WQH64938.1 hypothetical protein PXD04_03920 [Methanosphaera sp. ISO3-F5]